MGGLVAVSGGFQLCQLESGGEKKRRSCAIRERRTPHPPPSSSPPSLLILTRTHTKLLGMRGACRSTALTLRKQRCTAVELITTGPRTASVAPGTEVQMIPEDHRSPGTRIPSNTNVASASSRVCDLKQSSQAGGGVKEAGQAPSPSPLPSHSRASWPFCVRVFVRQGFLFAFGRLRAGTVRRMCSTVPEDDEGIERREKEKQGGWSRNKGQGDYGLMEQMSCHIDDSGCRNGSRSMNEWVIEEPVTPNSTPSSVLISLRPLALCSTPSPPSDNISPSPSLCMFPFLFYIERSPPPFRLM
ncbi:unnamed protein product [Pleuronectes platessa]|uniref:Uncharacterized protein n=1 Tax=Pleuronectes platessa TaxID=8262 RepID=A0A9N7ZCW4_PLEPL|nr:unnamed protein product [Pleuronectes platessa]